MTLNAFSNPLNHLTYEHNIRIQTNNAKLLQNPCSKHDAGLQNNINKSSVANWKLITTLMPTFPF